METKQSFEFEDDSFEVGEESVANEKDLVQNIDSNHNKQILY